ncbi:MAG: DNA-3-methyladenine glycosylase [Gemmatimonadetes bacterium]|nr:DNA-3-methyladenine glycosylase [Gemmatimonadota bacterium]MDE2676871.1 DNA-3-methyladenine glycosylase [Gemmatimonadota bacterium]MXX33187.1 DNA-3-methyladenine glycosylase [Gemmatimonadota bacterium]MYA10095.1 DNA-3-methyladenine glycosylase [Gemmatimonadota bacterium]MYD12484.1 DNA-3-methyladenine glycosylase [Gemmatimonadota bacterium]
MQHDWDFLSGDTAEVARRLLGSSLVSTVDGLETSGVIVETEAYLGLGDPASHAHASKGRTPRNDAMFAARGTLYVYVSYGIHHCVNVVTGEEGDPAAVLVRALDPVSGEETMARRRGRTTDLCSGPGRLAQALGITMRHNYHDLAQPPVRLLPGAPVEESRTGTSGRIGVSRAGDWPLRFFIRGHPAVKPPRW